MGRKGKTWSAVDPIRGDQCRLEAGFVTVNSGHHLLSRVHYFSDQNTNNASEGGDERAKLKGQLKSVWKKKLLWFCIFVDGTTTHHMNIS